MDSANSGSLQSSSGGEEEYDSRPNPNPNPNLNINIISPFLNNPSSSSSLFSSISNHPPTLFDPSQNNLHLFSHTPPPPSQTTNPLYNLDLAWTRNLRSEPNFTDFTNLTPFSSSSSSSSTQSLLGVQGLSQGPFASPSSSTDPTSTKPLQSDQPNASKNPKKRTRASRRAPTTVLTTDTSNFRQMVQEFTGIPAAPFSAGSAYSRRLDLFGSGPTMRSSHLDTLGPLYPLRPSAQKVQFQPSPYAPSSSSSAPSFFLSPTSNITGSNSSIVGATSSQPQSLLNVQNNPIMSFQQQTQSLLGVEHVGGFHGSGDASQVRESWRDGGEGGGGGHYGNNNNGSSDFNNHGRGMENVSSRGEGTVDSWICPSD